MNIIEAKNVSKIFTKIDYNWRDIFHVKKTESTAVDKLSIEIEKVNLSDF